MRSGKTNNKPKFYSWRWDKADLGCYYDSSGQYLSYIFPPEICDNCEIGCCDDTHLHSINAYYESVVFALQTASCLNIPHVPCHSLKPFWNEELDRLKADSCVLA